MFPFSSIEEILALALGLVVAITVHEASHAFVADKLGDPTPRLQGRLTLNPLSHLDPIGTLMILVARFGWGKPVQFDPYNLREPQKDSALISIAGPAANLATAVLIALIIRSTTPFIIYPSSFITILLTVAVININLAVFNLIPIPPLDGSKFFAGVFPGLAPVIYGMERYGFIILLALVFLFPGLLYSTIIPLAQAIQFLLFGFSF